MLSCDFCTAFFPTQTGHQPFLLPSCTVCPSLAAAQPRAAAPLDARTTNRENMSYAIRLPSVSSTCTVQCKLVYAAGYAQLHIAHRSWASGDGRDGVTATPTRRKRSSRPALSTITLSRPASSSALPAGRCRQSASWSLLPSAGRGKEGGNREQREHQ